MYHIHYTSLCLLFLIINIIYTLLITYVKCCYILILIHCGMGSQHSCMCPICVCKATQKVSVGMHSGCDTLSYKSCLCTCIFWHCHPYFILQFYSIVIYTLLISKTSKLSLSAYYNSMRVLVDNLYVLVGVAREEKHKGVWLIGVPTKMQCLQRSWALLNSLKYNEANFSKF